MTASQISTTAPTSRSTFLQNHPLIPIPAIDLTIIDAQSDDSLPTPIIDDHFDLQAALDKIERLYTHKPMPRDQRRSLCSRVWGYKIRLRDGTYMTFPFRCGDHRGCPNCRSIKAEELATRISTAVVRYGKNSVIMVEVNKEQANEIMSDVGKDNILRVPGEHKDVLFIANAETKRFREVGFIRLSSKKVWREVKWYEILRAAPESRNISGNLGKIEKKKEGVKITQKVLIVDAKALTLRNAGIRAFKKSQYKGCRPKSANELREMVKERERLIREEFEASGIEIKYTYPTHEYVRLEEVSWSMTQERNGVDVEFSDTG